MKELAPNLIRVTFYHSFYILNAVQLLPLISILSVFK